MKKALFVTILALASTSAYANRENTGCGLGTLVFKNPDSVVKQSLAITTNGTYNNQAFGITSGTLGCIKPASFVSNEKAKSFIANNLDQLAIDISKGKGESIDTLASLLKVEDKVSFKSKLQTNFSTIYSGEDVEAAHVIDSIVAIAG
jgi:hypothetical protein